MYLWTATVIYKNPFIVYDMKIKPTRTRVVLNGIKNFMGTYLSIRLGKGSQHIVPTTSN